MSKFFKSRSKVTVKVTCSKLMVLLEIGLKRYTAVSILFDSFWSVRSSIPFPYFRFGPFLFLATLMQEVNELRTDI